MAASFEDYAFCRECDGTYVAWAPGLDLCVWAKTEQAALDYLRMLFNSVVQSCAERGVTPPLPAGSLTTSVH